MTSADDEAVVREYMELAGVLVTEVDGGARYLEIWADDGVLEMPFFPEPAPRIFNGKAMISAMADAVSAGGPAMEKFAFHDIDLRATGRQGEFVVEMRSEALLRSGGAYSNRYCAIAKARDGKMLLWREYFDPTRLPS